MMGRKVSTVLRLVWLLVPCSLPTVVRFAEGIRTGASDAVFAEIQELAQTQAGREELLRIHQAVSEILPIARSGFPSPFSRIFRR